MNTRLFTSLALMCATASYAADFNLKVNLTDSIRPVTHVASGSLYGLTESLPADIAAHVAPLKPNAFLNPAVSGTGRQQPIGDAFKAAERIKSTTGKVHIRLADILPGWPYNWKGWEYWEQEVTAIVEKKKNSGLTNFDGYEIWNEPYGTWKEANGSYHEFIWKKTYDLLRRLEPNCRIIGPSFAYYNSTRMENFVKYCSENNCMPDVISWHQWGSGGFVGALEHYRSMEKKYNISTPRVISINEYCAGSDSENQKYEGCPGYSVPFIAKFERHGVESAMISWWFTNLPGRLGSLLTSQNQKGGGWHLYKWYGDMDGYMTSVTPPNDKSDGLDGFAAVNKKMREASIVLGGSSVGSVDVTIDIPEWMGSEVEVKTEVVTWENKDKAVDGPQTLAEETYTVSNGKIVVPVNVTSKLYGYRLYITPGESTPKSPFLGKALSIPGTIEAEYFDNGSDGISYHDKDRQNRGEGYRLETGVDVYALKDKSDEYAIGYTQKEEWLEYTVNIEKEAFYDIKAVLSSGGENSGIQLLIDGDSITGMLQTAPNENDWESYLETTTRSVSKLPQGEHILRLNIVGDWINIDKFIFTEFDPTSVANIDANEIHVFEIYDITGRKVGEFVSKVIDLPYDLKLSGLAKGAYIAKSEKSVAKIIVE